MSVEEEKKYKKEKSKREITDGAVETAHIVVGVKHRPVRRLHAAYQPAHPWNKPTLYPFLPFYCTKSQTLWYPQTHSALHLEFFPLLACLFDPFSWFCSCIVTFNLVASTPPGGQIWDTHRVDPSSAITDRFGLHPSSFPHLLSCSLQTKLLGGLKRSAISDVRSARGD